MHRDGERAEQWIRKHIHGSATVNSGAKYEDGDWRSIYRLYEVKERTLDDSIIIRADAVNKHIFRARKEALGPAFCVMTKSGWVYFVVPAEDFLMSAQSISHEEGVGMYQSAPGLVAKHGMNIKVKHDIVNMFRDTGNFMWKYGRKDKDIWVIVEAPYWLEICGES